MTSRLVGASMKKPDKNT